MNDLMRLDKFLSNMNVGSRKDVSILIRKGLVSVNDKVVKNTDYKINPSIDKIVCDNNIIIYNKYTYLMLNKPANFITATKDKNDKTVISLLRPPYDKMDLFPVGRLDKDTEGFLLLCNDGELAHRLTSPKYKANKTYFVRCKNKIDLSLIEVFNKGIDLGDFITMPSRLNIINDYEAYLSIYEGKFHQVKRMFLSVNNEVIYLKRLSFGGIKLDNRLNVGAYRELSSDEIISIKRGVGLT